MQIDLNKLASLEKVYKNSTLGMVSEGNPAMPYCETFSFIMDALRKYYDTAPDDVDSIESYFPIYADLQRLGIVSDAPEMEEIPDEEEDEEEDDNLEEED